MLIGSKSIKNKPYFSLNTSKFIRPFNYETIWFFSHTTYMDLKYKLTISKSQLIKRNYSILFFALNILSAFFLIPYTFFIKKGVLIFYNIYSLFLTTMGLFGGIKLSPNNMLIFFMGKCVVLSIFFIMFLYTIYNRGIGDGQIFYVYLPIVVDILFYAIHLSLLLPIMRWMLKSQNDNIEIEFDEIPKKAIKFEKNSEDQIESVIPPANPRKDSFKLDFDNDHLNSSQISDENSGIRLHNDNIGDDGNMCVICTTSQKAGAFYPCGHLCCCYECGIRFKKSKCPYCRKNVDDFIKLYEV